MKQIPNILTVLRVVLAGFFIRFFLQEDFSGILWATACFSLATITDWLDGYLARKYDVISSFGKIMDPIADKFLILSAFVLFAWLKLLPWWAFWVIAGREIGLTVFRFWAMARGQVLAAEQAGKLKTVVQMITTFFILSFLILVVGGFPDAAKVVSVCMHTVPFLVYTTVAVTLVSGLFVLWNNRELFQQK